MKQIKTAMLLKTKKNVCLCEGKQVTLSISTETQSKQNHTNVHRHHSHQTHTHTHHRKKNTQVYQIAAWNVLSLMGLKKSFEQIVAAPKNAKIRNERPKYASETELFDWHGCYPWGGKHIRTKLICIWLIVVTFLVHSTARTTKMWIPLSFFAWYDMNLHFLCCVNYHMRSHVTLGLTHTQINSNQSTKNEFSIHPTEPDIWLDSRCSPEFQLNRPIWRIKDIV